MRLLFLTVGMIGTIVLPGICNAQAVDDPFSDYLQRSDSIALSAGNASRANAAIQTINPWPPYAWDRRITIDGRRAVDSMERMYRTPNPFERAGEGGAPVGSGPGGNGTSGSPPVTPMQPISSGE
ncbi:MAG TPA: hypothetical protein VIY68_00685 [Steroidobacteraceae bacterium]